MKRYQVFVSSTYEDLEKEREQVFYTILKMQQIPIGMEYFGARDVESWDIIRRELDQSDYYVLILKHKYGSVIESGRDKGISWTEKEFRYAQKNNIPILAFLVDQNEPVLPKDFEADPARKGKMDAFKKLVEGSVQREIWRNKDDLCEKIATALSNEMRETERPGWVRCVGNYSDANIQNLNNEIRYWKEAAKKQEKTFREYRCVMTGRTEDEVNMDLTAMVEKELHFHETRLRAEADISVLEDGSIRFISKSLVKPGNLIHNVVLKNRETGNYVRTAFYSEDTISFVRTAAIEFGIGRPGEDCICAVDGSPAADSMKLSRTGLRDGSVIELG